jgi:pimeloyl-ACP methyl ester carboxylesterase
MDLRDVLKNLQVPFLAIAGGKDALVDPAIHTAAARLAPLGEVELFEDSGHAPFLEEPARFCALLLAFLGKSAR